VIRQISLGYAGPPRPERVRVPQPPAAIVRLRGRAPGRRAASTGPPA